jgi:hypothetical protein
MLHLKGLFARLSMDYLDLIIQRNDFNYFCISYIQSAWQKADSFGHPMCYAINIRFDLLFRLATIS